MDKAVAALKVAQTLADLEAEPNIATTHVAEAITYLIAWATRPE